jgi:hypothetical protein
MPYQYGDIYNDLFATTGLNLGASFDVRSDLFRRAYGTGGSSYGSHNLSTFRYTSGHNPFEQSVTGLRSHAALGAARSFDLGRRQQSAELYSKLVDESADYQTKVDSMLLASSLENEQFQKLQSDLDASKASLTDKGSVSSLGAYSAAAKRQLQNTGRILAELNSMSAPEQVDIDMSFINPITGDRVGQDATFDFNAGDIGAEVSKMVTDKYSTRRQEIVDQLDAGLKEQYGYRYNEFYSDERKDAMRTAEQYIAGMSEFDRNRLEQGYYDHTRMGDSGLNYNQYVELQNAESQYDSMLAFAESRALSEMTGTTEGYTTSRAEGGGMANIFMTGSQMFMEADRDVVLQQIIDDTTVAYETSSLNDMKALEQEFTRRKQNAASMASDTARRNELNQARAADIEAQKIQYAKLLKQQQQEYQSTLSSASAVETAGGGVTFTDTRPA